MGKDLTIAVRSYIELDQRVLQYQVNELSPLTRKLYAEIWQSFTNFLAPKDVWRAEPIDVARYITSRVLRGVTTGTLKRDMGGINYHFERLGKGAAHGRPGVGTKPSPARDVLVKKTYRGIARKHARPYERKRALLLDSLEKMIDRQPDNIWGIRNKAMLVVAWGAALRIIEVHGLDVHAKGDGDGWIEVSDDGVVVHLKRSKANQFRRRLEDYGIPARPSAPRYCPVALVRRWLEVSPTDGDLLFPALEGGYNSTGRRMNRNSIRTMIKVAAARIGIDPRTIGGQSLRRGCLTWLSSQGIDPFRIQDHSGHADIRQLLIYLERRAPLTDSPLCDTRWAR